MRKNRYTLDELLEELREQGFSDIQDIKYAVLENSGQLSVFPWNKKQPPTAEQLGLDEKDDMFLPVTLINDGKLLNKNLALCGKDTDWLQKKLRQHGFSSPSQVFLLTLDQQGTIFCIRKEHKT